MKTKKELTEKAKACFDSNINISAVHFTFDGNPFAKREQAEQHIFDMKRQGIKGVSEEEFNEIISFERSEIEEPTKKGKKKDGATDEGSAE